MLLRIFSLLSTFFFFFDNIKSQDSRADLERERNLNIQKINEAENILKETENSKVASIGRLNALNRQINNRQNHIRSLRFDIDIQNKEIRSLSSIISSLNNDVMVLKNEYADMVFNSYKSRSSLTQLSYIFSSEN